jgi:hypothetical protein
VTWFKKGLTPTWLKQVITEANGEIVDIKRLAGIGLAGQFSFMGFWALIVNHQAFDPIAFGTGAMAILGGIGAAIGLGRPGEADRPTQPPTSK